MDLYHIWCNLKSGVKDLDFVERVQAYLNHLKAQDQLIAYRVTRRKLGLGSADLPEFHIQLEFRDLAQLDQAFSSVASRRDPIEELHHAVNSQVREVRFALYRDFPDPVRERDDERF